MLNYAYAVLFSQVKLRLLSEGYDPTIGLLHAEGKFRDALVLDHMEPLRPVVDAKLIAVVLEQEFSAGDFTITSKGRCRLNFQLARAIALQVTAL